MMRKKEKKARSFEGFEHWLHAREMELKMVIYILVAAIVVWSFIYGVLVYLFTSDLTRHNFIAWVEAEGKHWIWPTAPISFADELDGELIERTAPAWAIVDSWRGWYLMWVLKKIVWWTLGGVIFSSGVLFLAVKFFRRKSEKELHSSKVIRGPEIEDPVQLGRKLRQEPWRIRLTKNLVLPVPFEVRHGFIAGTSGSGKSMFLKNFLIHIREISGARAVVFDVKGEFTSLFYDPDKDYIFNPLDSRCLKWSLFNDLHDDREVFDFARSFIPSSEENGGSDRYFADAARDVLASIFRIFLAKGGVSNEEVARVALGKVSEIADFLSSHPAGKVGLAHIAKPDSNQALGVCSTMMQAVRIFEYLVGLDGDFSFRRWIREGEGFLFLPVPLAFRELLAPILTAVIDLLIKELLSMPDDRDRRVFFIVDEMGMLGKITRLVDGLVLGRSKGMSLWIGIQDFGRIDLLYGRSIRETIWNNCLTKLVLRVSAPDTAEYLSKSLGESEIEEMRKGVSMGVEDLKDGMSFSQSITNRRLILASEISNLPDLQAIVKVGPHNPAIDQVEIVSWEPVAEEFVPRQIVPLHQIEEQRQRKEEEPSRSLEKEPEISIG